MKTEVYVMIDENNNYLILDQVSNYDIEVSPTNNFIYATHWTNIGEAKRKGIEMINDVGKWDYRYFDCTEPVKIVKMLMLAHEECEIDLSGCL